MKKAFLIISSSLIFLPACLILSICINYTWQPTAFFVSFSRLFPFILISLALIFLFHLKVLKKETLAPFQRSLIWLWTGPVFLVFLVFSYLRDKLFQKKNLREQILNYVISDCLVLFLYIFSTIALTLLNYLPVKSEMLFQYKKKHIAKGLMYYKQNWGWVDKIHYRPDHFTEILDALESGKTEVSLHDGWTTPLRFPVSYHCTYEFNAAITPLGRWAQATAMSLHFMALNERVQEESPWYHGNQLSAWQFDDLSSGLLACLEQSPKVNFHPNGKHIIERKKVLDIWQIEGREEILIKMDIEESWNLVHNKEIRPLIDRAQWKIKKLEIKH
jgi:hypothetical protein